VLPKNEQVLEKPGIGNINLIAERQTCLKERLVPRTEPPANRGVVVVAVLPILRLRYARRAKQLCDTAEVGEQLRATDWLS